MSEWRELYNISDEEILSSHVEIYKMTNFIICGDFLLDVVIRELDACISFGKCHKSEVQLSAEMLKMHLLNKRRKYVIHDGRSGWDD